LANNKPQPRSRLRRPLPPHVEQVEGPRTRLSALFHLLEEIYEAGDRDVFALTVPEDEDAARGLRLDAGILVRANNALKAVKLLCEQAHWEFAVAAVRQLFEIVVNVEYLNTQDDRGSAEFRFAKYGLLQMVLEQRGTLEYDERTGRQIDRQRKEILERMLESSFPEFRSVWVDRRCPLGEELVGTDDLTTRRAVSPAPPR
jgi:hypothetical protein